MLISFYRWVRCKLSWHMWGEWCEQPVCVKKADMCGTVLEEFVILPVRKCANCGHKEAKFVEEFSCGDKFWDGDSIAT